MQSLSTEFPPPTHTPSGTRPSPGTYMQPSSIGYIPVLHVTSALYPTTGDYMQPPGPPQTAYTPSGIRPIPVVYRMQKFGARPAAYTQLWVVKLTLTVHTQPFSM